MNSILAKLYWGEYAPRDCKIMNDKQYNEAVKIKTDCEEKLLETLRDKQKKLFEDFVNADHDLDSRYALFDFSEGFKLCVKLFMAGMN